MNIPRNRVSLRATTFLLAVSVAGCGGAEDTGLTGENSDPEGGGASNGAGTGAGGNGNGGNSNGGGTNAGGAGASGGGTGATGGGIGGSNSGGAGASGGGTGATGGGIGGKSCPSGLPGPALVLVDVGDDAFCIDSTEVTQKQYAKFLPHADAIDAHERCAWNDDALPVAPNPVTGPDPSTIFDSEAPSEFPVIGADWCDARAYCEWAGKRLCGRRGGGALSSADAAQPSLGEWGIACSHDGDRKYPYGNSFERGRCNDAIFDRSPIRMLTTAEELSCEGGYAGIFDLSGNVREWIDACEIAGNTGTKDECTALGGQVNLGEPADEFACAGAATSRRDGLYSSMGIRCCSGTR